MSRLADEVRRARSSQATRTIPQERPFMSRFLLPAGMDRINKGSYADVSLAYLAPSGTVHKLVPSTMDRPLLP